MDNKLSINNFETVALAGLQEPLRQELIGLLETNTGAVVVGKAESYPDIVLLVDSLRPEVLIAGPDIGGRRKLSEIGRVAEKTKVIAISGNSNPGDVLRVFKLGVLAYLKIDSASSEIAHAIRETVRRAALI